MFDKKVSIIGAGFVGSTIAFSLVLKSLVKEVVLIDTDIKKADAESLDILCGVRQENNTTIKSGDYYDLEDSDVIIITAGRGRKPGESRLDLISDNSNIAKEISKNIRRHSTNAMFIVVSNPVDLITSMYFDYLDVPKKRIFGTGCSLDCSRLIGVLSKLLCVSNQDIYVSIIGEHGDRSIILWEAIKIKGLSLATFCKLNGIDWDDRIKGEIESEVKSMGSNIISGKGKTQFGISSSVCEILESLFKNDNKIWSLSLIDQSFGKTIAYSLPCIFANGSIQEVDFELTSNENRNLTKTIEEFLNYRRKEM